MTKEKIVSGMFRSKDFVCFEMWRVKNAAYKFIDAKAKKKIKEMGFMKWLGTLPKPDLLKIQRELNPSREPEVTLHGVKSTPWLNRFNDI